LSLWRWRKIQRKSVIFQSFLINLLFLVPLAYWRYMDIQYHHFIEQTYLIKALTAHLLETKGEKSFQ
jgi:hypothetical protein